MILLGIVLVVTFLWGLSIIGFLCPAPLTRYLGLKVSLAPGVAFGLTSLGAFVWLLVAQSLQTVFVLVEMICVIATGVLLVALTRRRASENPRISVVRRLPQSKTDRILLVILSVVLLSALTYFILMAIRNPYGSWDAWAIWNLHAKFIYAGKEDWIRSLSPLLAWSHPDYPLLIPLSVARLWAYSGGETTTAPILVAMLFAFATVGLLVSAISILRTPREGMLAGVILSSGHFLRLDSWQTADIPLAFFILASLVLLTLHHELGDSRLLFLAGMMIGFAAWTKNEGLLFAFSIILASLAISLISKIRMTSKELLMFVLGLVPVLMVILFFKLVLAPPNDFVAAQSVGGSTARVSDWSRYLQVGRELAVAVFRVGNVFLPIVFLYLVVAGIRRERWVLFVWMALGLVWAGYFFVYVLMPSAPHRSLGHSAQRLFLQWWPSILFAVFLTGARALSGAGMQKEKAC